MRFVAAAFVSFGFLGLTVPAAAQHAAPDLFAASKEARTTSGCHMLLRQFRADEPTLPDHQDAAQKPAVALYQNVRAIPAGFWVWQRPYWFVFRDGPDAVPQHRQWGPEAACGAPDTGEPGDHPAAWAPKTADEKDEWLLLEYAEPVRVASIEVHETWNPGALAAVSVLTPQGDELELWSNREVKPAADKGRVLQIDLPLGFQVERVKLRFRGDAVPGFNEIDAVGLKDDKGKLHWAARAEASSSYAELAAQAGPPGGAGNFNVVLRGAFAVQAARPLNLQVQRLQLPVMPRIVMPAVKVHAAQLGVFPFAPAADPAKEQLQKRVAELEAKVKELEAELARAKAGK